MNDDPRGVDNRPNSALAKLFSFGADETDNRARFGDFAAAANLRELAPDKIDNQQPWDVDLAQRLKHYIYSRNRSARPLSHFVVHINLVRRRVIRPMIAPQGVRAALRAWATFAKRDSETLSNNPPLVCASASNMRSMRVADLKSVFFAAAFKLS